MLSAPAANAAGNIGVCHRTGGDRHPYVFQRVAANSTALQAHRDHQVNDNTENPGEDKFWKSDGVWNGIPHVKGGFKPDYIMGDANPPAGMPTDIDLFRTWCLKGLDSGGDNEDPTTVFLTDPGYQANGACAVPGWVTEPASEGISYTIDGGEDWGSITEGDHTVTATLDDAVNTQFESSLPAGWSPGAAAGTATYLVRLGTATSACLVPANAAAPSATGNTCTTPGHLVLPDVADDGYSWTGQVTDGPGDHVVTAVADAGRVMDGQVTWTVHVKAAGEGLTTCGGGTPGGGNPNPGTPDPQLTLVTPNYPSATEADCSHRGFLVVPPQPAGVLMTRTGSVPGDVTFTFAPADGYAFPDGTDTDVTVTVAKKLSGEDCILGEETTKPKPHGTKSPKPRDRAPIVLGTQAAVPTAVDAGLAGLPSASVSPISSPRLAQALVAGGLLLLIAGGSMGLGRRTRGAHES